MIIRFVLNNPGWVAIGIVQLAEIAWLVFLSFSLIGHRRRADRLVARVANLSKSVQKTSRTRHTARQPAIPPAGDPTGDPTTTRLTLPRSVPPFPTPLPKTIPINATGGRHSSR